ncbi:hypothetical protein [Jannaschia ovalis]|uniref:Lipoprotein n=1 Tax=Jannaschia ovalis TaxID=3038773 RepID=A0ABY8LDP8_9RHOB|nr:hypothetical protein [Jannaschia sp. GRR-S6-38]WGH79429.1 hypothetical protein P8627_03950 [Jannaschia sp. GRR-S6-38]
MRAVLSALLLLAACGSPHPLDGLTRSATASAGGHDFRVNWNLETAQATRMNRVFRPRLDDVLPAAIAATEQVTGCAVRPATAIGDVALVNMTLDCAGR